MILRSHAIGMIRRLLSQKYRQIFLCFILGKATWAADNNQSEAAGHAEKGILVNAETDATHAREALPGNGPFNACDSSVVPKQTQQGTPNETNEPSEQTLYRSWSHVLL